MSAYRLEIRVTPRPALLDPQGKAVEHALHALEFSQVQGVRVGRLITMEVEASSPEEAQEAGREMCRKILANPVTEDFRVDVVGGKEGTP